MDLMRSSATSTLYFPMVEVVAMIWRLMLVKQTLSSSMRSSVPTPLRARAPPHSRRLRRCRRWQRVLLINAPWHPCRGEVPFVKMNLTYDTPLYIFCQQFLCVIGNYLEFPITQKGTFFFYLLYYPYMKYSIVASSVSTVFRLNRSTASRPAISPSA